MLLLGCISVLTHYWEQDMSTNNSTRRTAIKMLVAGTVVSLGTACNALQSLPTGRRGGSTDGSALALRVREALRNHPYTSQLTVEISSNEDEVIIEGSVPSRADIENVEIVANQVEGVRHALIDLYARE